jgi:CRISPR-associated protein Cas4
LYGKLDGTVYKDIPQIAGTVAHTTIDTNTYSTSKDILQGIEVFSESLGLFGKIDTFDCRTGKLRERKKNIIRIYDGYVFQLYAQCAALREMGYVV